MKKLLQNSSVWLAAFYVFVRALSFFLRNNVTVQNTIAAILVAIFLYFCVKNLSIAWRLLVLELFLDGAGHFFELHGLLLRTWVLGIFACAWVWHRLRTRTIALPPRATFISFAIFAATLLWAALNGFLRGNPHMFVLQDAMLYLFLFLFFPALEMEGAWQPLYRAATKIFIFGSTLFSVLTFALYATSAAVLMDPYYHWFRDIAAGKITDLNMHFFRIVLAEQILFVPIILILFSALMKKMHDKKLWTLFICSLMVVILNFTRIYFIALAVGGVLLLCRAPWKVWLKTSALTLATAALIFFSFHFVASRGQSFGFELLGVRAAGIHAPTTDPSGAIRLALLPDIFKHIRAHPLMGSGLGTVVTYIDPVTHTPQIRTQFDWGYLQMITDLGTVGTLAYLIFVGMVLYNFAAATGANKTDAYVARGYLAGAAALFVINVTTPALFQGFGVLYFVLLIAATAHPEIIKRPS